VQVLHLGYLCESEARQLIEQAAQDSGVEYEPDATDRVLQLTRGHQCLIQLVCYEVVEFKNRQRPERRHWVQRGDIEPAVSPALNLDKMLFADIERDQGSPPAIARCVGWRVLASGRSRPAGH